jgi:hypothetical protein
LTTTGFVFTVIVTLLRPSAWTGAFEDVCDIDILQ